MPPTAVLVDPVNIPGEAVLSPDQVLLQEFKERLVGLEESLPADHELARWTEATAVSIAVGQLRRK